MILSFPNQKGGVGKTTLVVNLAYMLSRERGGKARVLLVDADPQGSALSWFCQRAVYYQRNGQPSAEDMARLTAVTVIGQPNSNIHLTIEKLAEGYDYVLIDAPPHSNEIFKSVILASNVAIVPLKPGPYDVWATSLETLKILKAAQAYNPELKAGLVLNMVKSNTAMAKSVRMTLEDADLPVFKASIGDRVAFPESASQGLAVLEHAPKSAAAKELLSLLKEIKDLAK